MSDQQLAPLATTGKRAVVIATMIDKSGKELVAARNEHFAKSIETFDAKVSEITADLESGDITTGDILRNIDTAEALSREQEVRGLSAKAESGRFLEALNIQVKAAHKADPKRNPGWKAFCTAENLKPGNYFPSVTPANDQILLARMSHMLPSTDELGAPWNMKTFVRFARSGSSIEKPHHRELLEYARDQKGTKTGELSLAYLDSIAEAANVEIPEKETTEKEKAKPQTVAEATARAIVAIDDVLNMDGGIKMRVKFTRKETRDFALFMVECKTRLAAMEAGTPAARKTRTPKVSK